MHLFVWIKLKIIVSTKRKQSSISMLLTNVWERICNTLYVGYNILILMTDVERFLVQILLSDIKSRAFISIIPRNFICQELGRPRYQRTRSLWANENLLYSLSILKIIDFQRRWPYFRFYYPSLRLPKLSTNKKSINESIFNLQNHQQLLLVQV